MIKQPHLLLLLFSMGLLLSACKKENSQETTDDTGPKVIFKFQFDSTQERLNSLGLPAVIPPGHGAQSPVFNGMSAHYVELAQGPLTALGGGAVLYRAEETNAGGDLAIDFSKSKIAGNGETFLTVPIKNIAKGTYQYIRVSLAYQNYDIKVRYNGLDFTGTVASFIGFNTYINTYKPKTISIPVNANKLQGYWAFEAYGQVLQGQAPAGATTVPNPIFNTSPIPQGSCVVTGPFSTPLEITGNEQKDITVIISLSTNKSFEWVDQNTDGIYDPANGDLVIDMGVRGLIPIVQ